MAQDLVELSLKRLSSRRVPKTKKYKHNLIEERQTLEKSAKCIIDSIWLLQKSATLSQDLLELLNLMLSKFSDKEDPVDEQAKGQFIEFIWHVCVPLQMIEIKSKVEI